MTLMPTIQKEQIKIIADRLRRMIVVGSLPPVFWDDLDKLLNIILDEYEGDESNK